MISGFVNRRLVPMIPVSFKRQDGYWEELDALLDTGFDGDLMLSRAAVKQHGLALRPFADSSLKLPHVNLDDYPQSYPPLNVWVDLSLKGDPQPVKVDKIQEVDHNPIVVGPSLLTTSRVTIDVVEKGLVEIDRIPYPTFLDSIRSSFRKSEPQLRPFNYPLDLPWTSLKIEDCEGEWQILTVNVDTGSDGELSLPPYLVDSLGLWLPGVRRLNTPDGPEDASCGKARIFRQGEPEPQTVECIRREGNHPPLIGMKLFRGKRITFDIDGSAPVVKVGPIPEPTFKHRLQQLRARLRRVDIESEFPRVIDSLRNGGRDALAEELIEMLRNIQENPAEAGIKLLSLRNMARLLIEQSEFEDPIVGPRSDGIMQAEWRIDGDGLLVMAFLEDNRIHCVLQTLGNSLSPPIYKSRQLSKKDALEQFGIIVPLRER